MRRVLSCEVDELESTQHDLLIELRSKIQAEAELKSSSEQAIASWTISAQVRGKLHASKLEASQQENEDQRLLLEAKCRELDEDLLEKENELRVCQEALQTEFDAKRAELEQRLEEVRRMECRIGCMV